jgi:chemotaxis protein CheZ
MEKDLRNEIKSVITIIEDFKNEIETLNIQKEGFSKINSHIQQSIQESERAAVSILNAINLAMNNIKDVKEILNFEGLSDSNLEKLNEKLDVSYNVLFESLPQLEFQDILAQRLQKISTFLTDLEKEILRLILLFGITEEKSEEKRKEMEDKLKEIEWKKEVEQNDVDLILKEFGM